MTVTRIARKDFRDAVQSRALWALVGAFVVLSLIASFAYVEAPELFGEPEGATFGGLILFTVGLLGLFVPIASIVVCYKAVAGEREIGSIKLLMSLPTTRLHVFLGKVIGRSVVLVVGLGVGMIVGLLFGAILLGEIDILASLSLVAVTIVFVVVYASIMVGISASTGSTTRATTLALAFFVIAELVWDVIPMGILYLVSGFQLPTEVPNWTFTLMQVAPSTAYFSSVMAALPDSGVVPNGAAETGVGGPPPGGDSIFLNPEFGYVVLGFWLVVPLAIGYYRFSTADI